MVTWWRRPTTLIDARVVTPHGLATSVRFSHRILAIDVPPRRGDVVVSVDGAFVLPGLVNAHDHLELNHYGALKRRSQYLNAVDWIDDLRPMLRADPQITRAMAFPLSARLFIGGLKNLLAGVTTVAHHNPLYREIRTSVPIRVVRRFGWAHSLAMQQQPVGARGELGGDVRRRCERTRSNRPFVVHASEGLDERAAAEMPRLQATGCVRDNSVFVHGVAWSVADWRALVSRGSGLVWCPASNIFLFGQTARVREFLDDSAASAGHICLGSDSRLTGARDLLDEMRSAQTAAVTAAELLEMVTRSARRVLRLDDAGEITVGALADLIIVPAISPTAAEALLECRRHDLQLIVVNGEPMLGEPRFHRLFNERRVPSAPLRVDGVARLARATLAKAITHCPIREPGVACTAAA